MQLGFCSLMIVFLLWMSKHKRIGIDIVSSIFLFKTHLFIFPRTSRNTHWVMDPFTQVKWLNPNKIHLKSGCIFPIFRKLNVQSIYNFLKILAWNWSGGYFFSLWSMGAERVSKSQNTRACTDKTGLSSMKLVGLIQIAGWSVNQRNLKMSAELLPLSRLT